MLKVLWISMLILGVILLLLSIILMAVFRVFYLIGELSGANAKKQIERLKNLNVNTSTAGNLVINSETGVEEEIPIKDFAMVKSSFSAKEYNDLEQEDDVSTSYQDIPQDSGKTSYIDTPDITSYMEDSDRTSFMEDFEDIDSTAYMEEAIKESENHSVVLIQEQTSLVFN